MQRPKKHGCEIEIGAVEASWHNRARQSRRCLLPEATLSAAERIAPAAALLVLMGRIFLYTTTGCPYSTRVRKIFSNRGIDVCEINIAQYPLALDDLARLSHGDTTVPQVFFNAKRIGVRSGPGQRRVVPPRPDSAGPGRRARAPRLADARRRRQSCPRG